MPIVADASVAIRGDLSKFSGDLKKAETQTKGLGGKLSGALSPGMLFGAVGGAVAAAQVIDFLGDATAAAGEFADTVSATGVIFDEEYTPALEKWAEEAHSAFGASKQDALAAANQFAVLGKAAGLTGQDLVDFSTEMVQLGGDLASFFGGSTEDAITAVGAALRGESEPIRRYGVLLDDATLRARAFEMGLIDTVKNALTPQQKALAAQAEILAQTSDAQGDFNRTSDGFANTQRELAAEMENLSIDIGEQLLPIMTEAAHIFRDFIPVLKEMIPVVVDVIKIAFTPLATVIGAIIDTFQRAQAIATNFALDFGDMGTEVHRVADDLGEDFQTVKDIIKRNMLEAGMSFEEATAAAERELKGIPPIAHIEGLRAAQAYKQGLVEGAPDVAAGAEEGLADPVEEVTAEAKIQAEEAARALTGAYAGELADGADDVENAWRILEEGAENEQTKAVRIAEAKAFLSSKALTDALHSEDPYRRLAAIEQRETVEAELQKLLTNAQYQAWLTGKTVPEAINANKQAAQDAAQGLRQRTIKGFQLTEADKQNVKSGGKSVGDAWIAGLSGSLTTGLFVISEKANDILDVLGHSLPTKGPLQHPERGGISIAEAWLGGMGKTIQAGAGSLLAGFSTSGVAGQVGIGAMSLPPNDAATRRSIQVNVLDAGVARSVGDIARGLREQDEVGNLP